MHSVNNDYFSHLVGTNHLVFVDGPNFSGRTDILRSATGLPTSDHNHLHVGKMAAGRCAYIGPEIYSAISGLTATVRAEIGLHAASQTDFIAAIRLLEETGLHNILDRNATILSGGEQAVVAAVCSIAMCPEIIGIDCAFEQVDQQLRIILLNHIRSGNIDSACALVADNEPESLPLMNTAIQAKSLVDAVQSKFAKERRIGDPVETWNVVDTKHTIQLYDVCFGYEKGVDIFSNASCSLQTGSIYMLEGPNGSGKSTFAKILAGVLRPRQGLISLNGVNADLWKTPGKIVSYHFQNPDMQLFSNTVAEEVSASLSEFGISQEDSRRLVGLSLEMFGLQGLEQENPFDLPFVLRKRLALAASLISPHRFLVLDEPTLGQDTTAATAIAAIIKTLAHQGRSVIVISHSNRLKRLLSYKSIRIENRILIQE
jgi:energy-coupling factor transport system ATP-binding protein